MVGLSEFDDKQRRALFSSHVGTYDDGRPGYPSSVFEHLQSTCGLGPDCDVLEVGPGTGQATGPMLGLGARVVAVEVGEQLALHLQKAFPTEALEVKVGEFESVDLETEAFDLVAAATSFHWVPSKVGLAKVARILKPGGAVALWWNHFGDPNREDPFRTAVQPILNEYAPEFADSEKSGGAGIGANPYALDVESRVAEIEKSGEFGPVEHHLISWTAAQTTAEIKAFLLSFSSWMALESERRSDLIEAIGDLVDTTFGGAVERPFLTAIYTARKG